MSKRKRGTIGRLALNLLALGIIVFVLGPFVWVISASLQPENELLKKPPSIIPRNPTFDNYNYIFTGEIPSSIEVKGVMRSRISQEARLISPAFKNSLIVSFWVMVINSLLGPPAAYAFSRFRFRGKSFMFNFILASRLMPVMAIAIPYYVIIKNMQLLDSLLSLILIHTTLSLPFTIWFLTLYISNISREIEEASLVDGCKPIDTLLKIVVPMIRPAWVTACVFAFMTSYNEFVFARFLTQSIKSQTGPVIIASIAGNPDVSYSLISVCITLGMIPPLILAVIMRNWLVKGLSMSATYK